MKRCPSTELAPCWRATATGREIDSDSGLTYWARWYEPQQGRFISEGPLGAACPSDRLLMQQDALAVIDFYMETLSMEERNDENAHLPSSKHRLSTRIKAAKNSRTPFKLDRDHVPGGTGDWLQRRLNYSGFLPTRETEGEGLATGKVVSGWIVS